MISFIKTFRLLIAGQLILVLGLFLSLVLTCAVNAADSLGDLRLPTKNYVNNGGFERGDEGWEIFAGRRLGTAVTEVRHSGQSCYKVTGLNDDNRYLNEYGIPLTPGRVYTLSAWMKCSGFKRAGDQGQVVNLTNYGWTKSAHLEPKKPDEDWTRYSVTFTAMPTQDDGNGPIYTLVIFWPVKSEGTVWIDDIQIEEGDHSSDFTELYYGWALDTLTGLRSVLRQAKESQSNLEANFSSYPVAKSLGAKAVAVIEKANAVGDRLKDYTALSLSEAQSLPRQVEELKKEALSLRFLYYLGNPYLPLSEVAIPETEPGEMKVEWTCLSGERRAIALNVANFTGRAFTSRIVPRELTDITRSLRVVGVSWVTSYNVPEIRGHLKPGTLYTDPMLRSDEAGSFFIGNGKVNQAILLFDTSSLLPGEYRGSVEIASLTDATDRHSLTVKLTVLPLRLPNLSSVSISDIGTMASYAMDSVKPLGLNTFTVSPQWVIPEFDPTGKGNLRVDFNRVDVLVKERLAYCPNARLFFSFGAGASISNHLKLTYGITAKDPLFKIFAANWVQLVVKHFATLGIGPERLIFETADEPSSEQCEEASLWAEIIKKTSPRAQSASLVTGFHSDDKACLRLYETHDIIGPGFASINEASVGHLKKLGKKIWVYDCQNSGETFHPIAYYRVLPWLAWKYQLDGWGHFSWLDSARGRNYEPWEGVAEESLVYPNQSGSQVISRRWLAIVAGTQDYQVLLALKALVEATKAEKTVSPFVAKAQALLNDLPTQALKMLNPGSHYFRGLAGGADPDLLDRSREEIAEVAGELLKTRESELKSFSPSLNSKDNKAILILNLSQSRAKTVIARNEAISSFKTVVRYLCNNQLPWHSLSAKLPAGKGEIVIPCGPGDRITRCFAEIDDELGVISVGSLFPLPRISVDSTYPDYDASLLNDGLAMPGMKFEPDQGWISGAAATEHWVIASFEQPVSVKNVRLWWMNFYGNPQAYKIQIWADGAWKDAPGSTSWRSASAAVEDVGFLSVVTDKIRILQKAGGGNRTFPNLMGLSEVEVY